MNSEQNKHLLTKIALPDAFECRLKRKQMNAIRIQVLIVMAGGLGARSLR